ncbi:MAG: acyl-ACP--UDP-N-acetylglucosamine O-acyltransferase [Chitinophagales bacterium]|nr:acyl-ACP--UDP-N-acetylglucosamine O-acyltransferase [Chitinophagales bacterium]
MNQPLAYVHPQAQIADNVVVEPFAFISKDVEIGEGTWIGPNTTIMPHTKIGKNCRIFPGAVIGAVPQDLKYANEKTQVLIGDNTTIRECVTIHRGTKYAEKTVVGDNCLLMAYVHLAHDCLLGNHVILANSVALAGHVEVGDWVIMEGIVAVQQFIKVGQHAFIAGGSLVRKDVPPYVKAAREPLSYVGVNSIGLRRRGFSSETIQQIQDIYRLLFVRGYNISKALSIIEAELPASPERDIIVTFIRNSKGGVMKSFRQSIE